MLLLATEHDAQVAAKDRKALAEEEANQIRVALTALHKEYSFKTLMLGGVYPYLPGAKSPAFQGISIFIGVLFSLGLTSAVANIVAGIVLIYMRAFRLGDRLQIADTVGDVVEVSLLVTRIRTFVLQTALDDFYVHCEINALTA